MRYVFANRPFKYVIPRTSDTISNYNDLMSEAPQSFQSEGPVSTGKIIQDDVERETTTTPRSEY